MKVNLEEAKKLALVQYENQKKILDEKLESVKAIFGAGGLQPRTPDEEWYHKRVRRGLDRWTVINVKLTFIYRLASGCRDMRTLLV